jgi:hypothetical protein
MVGIFDFIKLSYFLTFCIYDSIGLIHKLHLEKSKNSKYYLMDLKRAIPGLFY